MTIDELERARAALPSGLDLLNLSGRAQEEVWLQRRVYDARIQVARIETQNVSQLDPQIAALTQQRDDLTAIREEVSADLVAGPTRAGTRAEMHALQRMKISILIIDGRFDLANEAIPTPLPLFEKLTARGYSAPMHAAWNPMAALFGSLPSMERRLAELLKQRDHAREKLDSVLRDPVTA